MVGTSSPSNSSSSSAVALAARSNSLGVGFSGSGFLIFYFTGVTAILKQLGVINSKTRLAGASGGAANAALTCGGVPLQPQYDDLLNMAAMCRPTIPACQGFLDLQVNSSLTASLPANTAQLCSGRLWVSITSAMPDGKPDPNVLLGSQWFSKQQVISAVRLSAYVPGISGLSVTNQLADLASIGPGYDGGFSQNLPCPPGVKQCVRVAAFPYDPKVPLDAGPQAAVEKFNKMAAIQSQNSPAARFLPLDPVIIPSQVPDIYPGLSQPLPVNATVWASFGFQIPDNATLRRIFDIGRQDAVFWAEKQGLAGAPQVTQALQATALKS